MRRTQAIRNLRTGSLLLIMAVLLVQCQEEQVESATAGTMQELGGTQQTALEQEQAQEGEQPSAPPSPTEPFLISTFEIDQVRVVPIATGLANPWGMAFRDNGDILITERYTGRLRVVRDGKLLDSDISGVPEVYSEVFRAGLMAVAIHPEDDQIIYLTRTKAIMHEGEPNQAVSLVRARLVEDTLTDVQEIFVAKGVDSAIAASALLFTADGKLMMSVGGAYMFANTRPCGPLRQASAPE